jgi:NAD(P)-dependent dehydrogenase (short-subunit alcohol dehydrogenase family)
MMDLNVVGLMLCCREAARRMALSRGGQGGAIVNVSSMAATIGGRPGASAYAASKAAVDVFTTGLAKELAPEGIRVNAVRPGMTLTDMTADVQADPVRLRAVAATIPMQRCGEPEEIAAAILFLLSDAASYVSGTHLNASGGGFLVGR